MWDGLLDHMLGVLIRKGTLYVHLPGGRVLRHGDGTAPQVTVHLKDPDLVAKLVRNPDLHVGEAYMNGTMTIDGDDLYAFLKLMICNFAATNPVWWQRSLNTARSALRHLSQFNPVQRARANVAHHYDLSGALYDLFLDVDRQYSCAYFKSTGDTLEQAQAQKKAHIAAKLRLQPGMRVLDIGCGWGGLALTLARDYGVRVLGVTLSEEQYKLANARALRAGLADRVEFRFTDYRSVTGIFDRIISVGMFEHVGAPHYREYFRHVEEKLDNDGVALIHTIGRSRPPGVSSQWMLKYIFPGGYVPAISEMMKAVEKEGLLTCDVEVWRLHYAETLRIWHDRFVANIDRARAIYDERFCRMWRYYLLSMRVCFEVGLQVVYQVQLSKKLDTVPIIRDYLYQDLSRVEILRDTAAE